MMRFASGEKKTDISASGRRRVANGHPTPSASAKNWQDEGTLPWVSCELPMDSNRFAKRQGALSTFVQV
jgi:hypothetical protein